MIQPVLAHGSGVDDIGFPVMIALVAAGLWAAVRRMRESEQRRQADEVDRATRNDHPSDPEGE